MSDNSTQLVREVEYRPIEGFPPYRIGNDGSVWTCLMRDGATYALGTQWKQMSTYPVNGYPYVRLRRNGRKVRKRVPVMVLEAFVCKRPKGLECRHLDGVRANSNVTNLAWGTSKENQQDKVRHGTSRNGRHNAAKLTESQVLEVVSLKRQGVSAGDIAAKFGISKDNVWLITSGKTWSDVTGIQRRALP
jgi:hypothetical protein